MRPQMIEVAFGALLAAAVAAAQQSTPEPSRQAASQATSQKEATASGTFVDTKGRQIGKATLTQTPNGVLVAIDVSDLPPGEHAFHFHQTGNCDPSGGFKSAGDHFAPGGTRHGFEVSGGPHAGDMPNQFVSTDGALRAHVINPNVSLGSGKASLLDADGTAIVIHAKPDDYKSQPSGNAGDRIACAVLKRGG